MSFESLGALQPCARKPAITILPFVVIFVSCLVLGMYIILVNLHGNLLRKHETVLMGQMRKQIQTCNLPPNHATARGCAGRVLPFLCIVIIFAKAMPGCLTLVLNIVLGEREHEVTSPTK